MCEMYEMKMNNLLVDVEIFSLCRKEILFEGEFQQYNIQLFGRMLSDI